MEALDPLKLDLQRQVAALNAALGVHVVDGTVSRVALLNSLSRLLAAPQCTLQVAKFFRPLLVDLIARWLLDIDVTEEARFVALALLIETHEEIFPILAEFLQRPSLAKGPVAFVTKENAASLPAATLQPILLAYARILRACPLLPHHLNWPLHPLLYIIHSGYPHRGVMYLAIHCYAFHANMPELRREEMQQQYLGELGLEDCEIDYGLDERGEPVTTDGWLLALTESNRILDKRQEIATTALPYMATATLAPEDICPRVANVQGVLLLRDSTAPAPTSALVMTPSLREPLQLLAAQYSLRLPTLLTSTQSAGKALLLAHLAAQLHPTTAAQLVVIHLADTSIDARSLIGSHISSQTVPGKFEWKEGVLLRAMREGRWIVLKDIDRASMEVLGVLMPLVESVMVCKYIGSKAYIDVPNRGRVWAHDAFAIFATRSAVLTGETFPAPTFFGAHKFTEIVIPTPRKEDLLSIVGTQFPRLSGSPAAALIRLWNSLRALGPAAGTRPIGMRELDKWCSRVASLLPASWAPMDTDSDADPFSLAQIFTHPSTREELFLEARDVFFGTGAVTASAVTRNAELARLVAEALELSSERTAWLLESYTPVLDNDKDANGLTLALRVGRTRLPARSPPLAKIEASSPFAIHRPALVLLSRIATAVALNEPVLLTGETGTGKTTLVAHVASRLGRRLVALNLSNQSEAADLVGGFKPVDARVPGGEIQDAFGALFSRTFSRRKNEKFEDAVGKAVREGKWKRAVGLWREAGKLARERILARDDQERDRDEADAPRKRRKLNEEAQVSMEEWDAFERQVASFEVQHVLAKGKLAFAFVEGPLLKALRSGDWVLLDEVNLATPETLECVSALLQGPTASITLTEHGSLEPVPRHPDFRLFACMNPATDVGKKDLPPNIRSRFTEIFVTPPDADRETLLSIVQLHIGHLAVGDRTAVADIADFYTAAKRLAEARELADGSNQRPHYSMRTLTRMLSFVADAAPAFKLRRAMWEGGLMAFAMALGEKSSEVMTALAEKHLLAGAKNVNSLLSQVPPVPSHAPREDFVQVGPYWLQRGPHEMQAVEEYIVTPSVAKKLIDLARVVYAKRFPVLIEGPTSSGKTSAIEYLAKRTGHRFVRINNHEHTDIQEYIGSYLTDPETGKLTFQDGILVRALRNGDWIVLDELNLAPTDVLEALNRLLDDNRELLIPETLEVVKPHANFRLFATQNPPGLYAGRKVLSRAFRNRFLEVQFDDVPEAELEEILCRRTRIAPPYASRIVAVFRELQKRRQTSRVFETKNGFATLRDLFRWAGRDAISYLELAQNGYMLLAERARRADDKVIVKDVLESIMKVTIDEASLYGLGDGPSPELQARLGGVSVPSSTTRVVWTSAMHRLYVLVATALRYNEPVLLVGQTGCGKTSVCEVFAEATSRVLYTVSCHQNTETADIIGGQRPVRNRAATLGSLCADAATTLRKHGLDGPSASDPEATVKCLDRHLASGVPAADAVAALTELRRSILHARALFQWYDGPLVEAMRSGNLFLLDEISLADDSVLERLNSVLEPDRTVVLAEMGGRSLEDARVIADPAFKLVATMNPGGDYGKKELSPALRNRFTEIWVPAVDKRDDRRLIIQNLWQHADLQSCTEPLLDLADWLRGKFGEEEVLGLRDILAWVAFSNHFKARSAESSQTVFTSGFSPHAIQELRASIESKIIDLVPVAEAASSFALTEDDVSFSIGPFSVAKGLSPPSVSSFDLSAPTTLSNARRVLRALQVPKPILLEGSPGVGKTSLVVALAGRTGNSLVRINLSDQTDLVDLFGSDLPVQGGKPGEFAWKDAAFLHALQHGEWVLLDEMNLAPQAVLEGLNAVLDHRGEVFIPELSRSFRCHTNFRVFAAQNPQHQGGGRKGLPKSFLNRFTKVHLRELGTDDLLSICHRLHPLMPDVTLKEMIDFNSRLHDETMIKRTFGRAGSPWEFNLRDILRWASLLSSGRGLNLSTRPQEYLDTMYLRRFRSGADRAQVLSLFRGVIEDASVAPPLRPSPSITPGLFQVGHTLLQATECAYVEPRPCMLLQNHLPALEAFGTSVNSGALTILVGQDIAGKTSLVRFLAQQGGHRLWECAMHGSIDTADLLGTFEQIDSTARLRAVFARVKNRLASIAQSDPTFLLGVDLDDMNLLDCVRAETTYTAEEITSLAQRVSDTLQELASRYPAFTDLAYDLRLVAAPAPGDVAFEWSDGPLVQALKEGHWLFLDNANLCSPSVLDRLNSLCETDGSIILSECGLVNDRPVVLKPHRNFRLILGVNPRYGELSRAMRNRGFEIYVDHDLPAEDFSRLHSLTRSVPSPDRSVTVLGPDAAHFELTRRGLRGAYSSVGFPLRDFLRMDSLPSSLVSFHRSLLSVPTDLYTVPATVLALLGRSSQRYFHVQIRSMFTFAKNDDHLKVQVSAVVEGLRHGHPVIRAISTLLESFAHTRGVPLLFYRAQPFNFILNPHCVSDGESTPVLRPDLALELWMRQMELASRLQRLKSAKKPRTILRLARESVEGTASHDVSPTSILLWDVLVRLIPVLQEVWQSVDSEPSLLTQAYLAAVLDATDLASHLIDVGDSATLEYSALLVLAARLRDAIQDEPQLAGLRNPVIQLVDSMSSNCGQGLDQIWESHMLIRIRVARVHKNAHALRSTAGHPSSASRRAALELVSSLAVNEVLAAQNVLLPLKPSTPTSQEVAARQESQPTVTSLILSLNFNGLAMTQSDLAHEVGSTLLRLVCREPEDERQAWVSTQLLVWAVDDATSKPEGASILLDSTMSKNVVAMCTSKGHPIARLPDYDSELRTLAGFVAAMAHILPGGRKSELFIMLLGSLRSDPISDEESSLVLGRLWMTVGFLTLRVYVPGVPLDPLAAQACQYKVLQESERRLRAQLAVAERLELHHTGNSDSPLLAIIRSRLHDVQNKLARIPARDISRDTDAAVYQKLHAEIAAFVQQVAAPAKLNALALDVGAGREYGTVRIQSTISTITAFLQRIATSYPLHDDIIAPVHDAAQHIMTGLSIVLHAATKADASLFAFAKHLCRLPSGAAMDSIRHDADQSMRYCSPSDALLLSLAAFAHETRLGVNWESSDRVVAVDELYHRLCAVWLADRQREEQQKRRDASLYRHTHEDHSAEEEENEFRALFPDFADSLENHDSAVTVNGDTTPLQHVTLTADNVAQAWTLHQQLWLDRPTKVNNVFTACGTLLLQHLLQSPAALSCSLDATAWGWQMSRLREALASTEAARPNDYNFYHDANIPEIKKAHVVLASLDTRLSALVDTWPDQMVLHDIRSRCRAILALDIGSSIAKVLSALEFLLLHCDDWERYANRDNSLKHHQEALIALIVQWRRLELSFWSRLLVAELRVCEAGVAEWWFHLYDMLVRGALASAEDEDPAACDNYVATVVPLLDGYLNGSPLGQFDARLDLLLSFAHFTRHLARTRQTAAARILERISRILTMVHAAYSRYLPAVQAAITETRTKLDKEITDFIRLASWKDINVYALKQSAQRTHRQLHKCIRKFRDTIRQAVSSVISQHTPSRLGSLLASPYYSAPPSTADIPQLRHTTSHRHLVDAGATLHRLDSLLQTSILPGIRRAVFKPVDTLAGEIVQLTHALGSASIDTSSKSQVKGLLQRKQRAWSDMAKELRRAGVPLRLKPNVLENQKRREWLMDQPHIDTTAAFAFGAESALSIDSFFVGLVDSMATLRAAVTAHHKVIPARELDRGVSAVEATFRMGVDARTSFSEGMGMFCRLQQLCARLKHVSPDVELAAIDEMEVLRKAHQQLHGTRTVLDDAMRDEPRIHSLVHPVAEWVSETLAQLGQPDALLSPTSAASTQSGELADTAINTILVVCQELQKAASSPIAVGSEDEPPDNYIAEGASFVRKIALNLRTGAVLSAVEAALASLTNVDTSSAAATIRRIVPFLDRFAALVHDHVVESALWTRAVFKLANVLCTTVLSVAQNGWCQPQEADDKAGGDDAGNQQVEGTGLGSGTGEKNVSNEIEDESQVEGLQDETANDEESPEKASGDKDNTIEMSEDFGGATENVEEEAEDEDEDEDDHDDQDDVEDRVDDVDPTDPNAVDEKMWGDDSSPESKDSDDKTQKGAQSSSKDSELAAKEDEKGRQPEKPAEDGASGEQEDDAPDEQEEVAEEEGPTDEGVGAGGKMDEYTQDGDALDLPDDLDLAPEDAEKAGSDDGGMEDEMEEEEVHGGDKPDDVVVDGEEPPDELGDQPMQDESGEVYDPATEDTATAQPDLSSGTDRDGQTDSHGGGGSMEKTQRDETATMDVDASDETPEGADTSRTERPAQSTTANDSAQEAGDDPQDGQEASSATQGESGAAADATPLPNPLRHLGDALKEIQRRLQEILEPPATSGPNSTAQENKDVEYLQNEDDAPDMQALGPANGAESAKLDELKFSDAQDQGPEHDLNAMDVDDTQPTARPPPSVQTQQTPRPTEQDNRDAAIAHAHDRRRDIGEGDDDSDLLSELVVAASDDKIDAEEFKQDSAAVELALRQWNESGHSSLESENLWRKYESLTHHLAYALCEQLRLILEPTRASRLRGDYRTGKRLNMKKIIPYIASEYTKDKIWLRRTRPSDREYQILLALDDSRSMAESHSVHLAFETLALVSRAVTRLEAGDVAIARFGETVDMLHGFDAGPFTEHAGARIVRDFTFQQKATDVAGLVETSLKVLGEARERRAMSSATAADLWQLQIIISDGMCQSHDRLRVLLRRAEEQRIMIVFVVIDALRKSGGQENSIMTMSQVVEKRVGDKVDFEMRRYLDSFPFQYYVVLRDVEALPEVLSGTLKQFFERISEE
ncbi:hypothetical protein EXIGLDRAFT_754664 [Exidia glandulosa HHB12029]|uniref:Midasin n=1 Tax=Exidia glandulosa HHB12029 TaxID=1314781 RepID=A0A165CR94_EXIGL|nr:hypothetical protein EXIGLDRAFT_754664 [Exidia glandulosa HHB12029]